MFIKSNWAAVAWAIAALVLVVAVNCLAAFLYPADLNFSNGSSPPEVGRVYSKEELDAKERRAQEELTKVREYIHGSGAHGVVWEDWQQSLPYVALTALAVILLAARRARISAVLTMSLPVVALMAVSRVNPIFLLLAVGALFFYSKLRSRVGGFPGEK